VAESAAKQLARLRDFLTSQGIVIPDGSTEVDTAIRLLTPRASTTGWSAGAQATRSREVEPRWKDRDKQKGKMA